MRYHSLRRSLNGSLLGLALLCPYAWANMAQEYTLTDLGPLPPGPNYINAMDKQTGEVVGSIDSPRVSGYREAYEFYPNPHTIGPFLSEAIDSFGGHVVGYIDHGIAASTFDSHATLWVDGVPHELGDLGSADGSSPLTSRATCINAAGDIWGVGDALPLNRGSESPLFWADGTLLVELPTLGGGKGGVFACNERGDSAGWSLTTEGATHCAFWPAAGGVEDCHPHHGTTESRAVDMNNVGQLVGTAVQNGKTFGFLRAWPAIFWLMPLRGDEQSFVKAMNDTGDIVGSSCTRFMGCRATAWENGRPTELLPRVKDAVGWTFYEANAIDNNGHILVTGTLNGASHLALLTPVAEPTFAFFNWKWRIYNYYVDRWDSWRRDIEFYYRPDLKARR